MVEKDYDKDYVDNKISIAPDDRHLVTTPIFDKNYFKENQAYEIFDGIRVSLGILRAYESDCLHFVYTKNQYAEKFDILLSEYELNQYKITRLTDVEGI